MKGNSNEKYIEGAKFIWLFVGIVCSYLTWIGLGMVSNEMFSFFPKVFPVTLLGLFVFTIPSLTRVDKFFAGGLLFLTVIPIVFYYNESYYLRFYWFIPLTLAFIFLAGKFSFDETYRTILLYFAGGYSAVMFLKMIMVYFELGNLILWINKNLIAGPTFFACMLAIILIDRMELDYPLLLEGIISLIGIAVFYLCDSWTPMFSFLAFLILNLGFKYISALRRFAEQKIVWVMLFSAIFLFVPVFTYILAANNGFGMRFSGRVEIWHELFYYWTGETKNILIGTGTSFSAARTELAAHSAYLDILWRYGLIGYIIFFGGILVLLFRYNQNKYSTNQLFCLTAFFVTCIHATMENYLSTFQWIPMIFIFLGLFISQSERASVLELGQSVETMEMEEDLETTETTENEQV